MGDFNASYIATRELTAGHTLDSAQSFDIDLRQLVPITKIKASQVLTPSDAETEFDSYATEYLVETKMMDNALMLLCQEFILSNSASEKFTVSLQGAAVRDAQILLDRTVSPKPAGQLKWRYAFRIRVY